MARHFFWEPLEDNIVQERDGAGNVLVEYTTEPGLYGNVISQNRNGEERQYHFDAVGSTLSLSDGDQQITDARAYTTFGETTEQSGNTVIPFLYIGRRGYYFDEGSDSYYVRRRDYSQRHNRWFAPDPIGFKDSVNRYLYSLNNPTGYSDPSGLTVYIYGWEGFGAAFGISTSPISKVYKKIAEDVLGKDVKVDVKFQRKLVEWATTFKDAQAIIDIAKKPEKDDCFPRIILIGYSWGANYASNVAAAMQHLDAKLKIDAVFTIDPVFGNPSKSSVIKEFSGLLGTKFVRVNPKNFCKWTNYYQTSASFPFPSIVGDQLDFAVNVAIGEKKLLDGPYANLPPTLPFPDKDSAKNGHNYIPYLEGIQDEWRVILGKFKGNSMRDDYQDCNSTCPAESRPCECDCYAV